MRKASAVAGTAAFFILAPGVVAGLVPWCITGWTVAEPRWPKPVRVIGVGLLVPALAALVNAFIRFVQEGRGTPAPVAPTERLVVGGLYRHAGTRSQPCFGRKGRSTKRIGARCRVGGRACGPWRSSE